MSRTTEQYNRHQSHCWYNSTYPFLRSGLLRIWSGGMLLRCQGSEESHPPTTPSSQVATKDNIRDAEFTFGLNRLLCDLYFTLMSLPATALLFAVELGVAHDNPVGSSPIRYLDCSFKGVAWVSYLASGCCGNFIRHGICIVVVHNVAQGHEPLRGRTRGACRLVSFLISM